MELEEQKILYETLQRVQQSLNERFERDASLYIPIEKVEEIKQMIYEGNYATIYGLYKAKKYSAEVLTNLVIKNAWLMKVKEYQNLVTLFQACDLAYLKQLMEDYVFDNKLDMSSSFRSEIIGVYLKRSSAEECQKLLDENILLLGNPSLRAICFNNCLRELSPLERYKQFNKYARKWPAILNDKSALAFNELFSENDYDNTLYEKIFLEQLANADSNPQIMAFWRKRLPNSGIEFMLKQMVAYFQSHKTDIRACRVVLNRLLNFAKKNMALFFPYFIKGCKVVDNRVRDELIRKALERLYNPNQRESFTKKLKEAGLPIPEEEDIPDLNEIGNMLCQRHISEKKMRFLTAIFNKQYQKKSAKYLDELSEKCMNHDCYENFEEFCLVLMETCGRMNLQYLLYAIKVIAINNDVGIDRRILKYIENQDLLRGKGAVKRFKPAIAEFVKEKDFNLFLRLTA